MARIPTYTAEGGIPAGGTGPQASAAAFAAPARALGGLGETIAQTGEQVSRGMFRLAEVKKQRQEQDDAFWAAKTATDLNRDLLKFYDDNKGKEDQADGFLAESEARLSALEATAPNPNAAKKLRLAIDDNITTIYGRALSLSSQIREQNRISEVEVNAQTLGETINSSDDLTRPLALMTAQSTIGKQLNLINSLPYSDSAKRKIRGAYLETLALNVSSNAPEFALDLINTTDIDETRKVALRNQFDNYQKSAKKVEQFQFEKGWKAALDNGYEKDIQVQIPSDDEFKSVYGKDWEIEKLRAKEQFDIANNVVGEWNKIRDQSSEYQSAYIAKNFSKYHRGVNAELQRRLQISIRQQSGPEVVDWLMQNNKSVQRMFDIANNTKNPELRAGKLTAANALMLQYQGQAPSVISDPEERKKYLGRSTSQLHLLQSGDAQRRADLINAMPGPRLASYMAELAAEFPDDKQRAIVWNDLVTMPKNGISAEIQFAQMMPDQALRETYLGIVQSKEAIADLSPEKKQKYEKALDEVAGWRNFSQAVDSNPDAQRSPMLSKFHGAVVSYAQRMGTKMGLSPEGAAKLAVEHLIDGSWIFQNVNGSVVAIQRIRDDFGRKKPRTDEEGNDLGFKLSSAIYRIPIDQVSLKNPSGQPVFPKQELILNDIEKLDAVQMAIRSTAFWYMNADGQGAQLYVRDPETKREFPLLDKSGKPFEVDFDTLTNTKMDEFASVVSISGLYGFGTQQKPNETYPRLLQTPGVTGFIRSPFAAETKTNLPPVGSYWKNLQGEAAQPAR